MAVPPPALLCRWPARRWTLEARHAPSASASTVRTQVVGCAGGWWLAGAGGCGRGRGRASTWGEHLVRSMRGRRRRGGACRAIPCRLPPSRLPAQRRRAATACRTCWGASPPTPPPTWRPSRPLRSELGWLWAPARVRCHCRAANAAVTAAAAWSPQPHCVACCACNPGWSPACPHLCQPAPTPHPPPPHPHPQAAAGRHAGAPGHGAGPRAADHRPGTRAVHGCAACGTCLCENSWHGSAAGLCCPPCAPPGASCRKVTPAAAPVPSARHHPLLFFPPPTLPRRQLQGAGRRQGRRVPGGHRQQARRCGARGGEAGGWARRRGPGRCCSAAERWFAQLCGLLPLPPRLLTTVFHQQRTLAQTMLAEGLNFPGTFPDLILRPGEEYRNQARDRAGSCGQERPVCLPACQAGFAPACLLVLSATLRPAPARRRSCGASSSSHPLRQARPAAWRPPRRRGVPRRWH